MHGCSVRCHDTSGTRVLRRASKTVPFTRLEINQIDPHGLQVWLRQMISWLATLETKVLKVQPGRRHGLAISLERRLPMPISPRRLALCRVFTWWPLRKIICADLEGLSTHTIGATAHSAELIVTRVRIVAVQRPKAFADRRNPSN